MNVNPKGVLASLVAGALIVAGGAARAEEKTVRKTVHKEAHAEDHKEAHGEGKAEAKAEARAEAHCDGEVKVEIFKDGKKVEGGVADLPADMRERMEKWLQESERRHREFMEKAKAAGLGKGCEGADAPAAGKPGARKPAEEGGRKCGGEENPEDRPAPNDDDVTRRVKKIEKDLKKGDSKEKCGGPEGKGEKPEVKREKPERKPERAEPAKRNK